MTHTIRLTFIFCAALLAAVCLGAGAAAPARALSNDAQMTHAIQALRGIIDRDGEQHWFEYPQPWMVQPGRIGGSWWPDNPWTGNDLRPGSRTGYYTYTVNSTRRKYRLVGYLSRGRKIVINGGMPKRMKLAYDHRSEEGINLIRQYVEAWAAANGGKYPLKAQVRPDGAVRLQPKRRYWPSNPWDHLDMEQRSDRGSFSYTVSSDRTSYTLRLHRALKSDYVLKGTSATNPWRQLLTSLQDEILRRSGRILAGYVDQWSLQHAGALPTAVEMAPAGDVGAVHSDWPLDPVTGDPMQPGTSAGRFTYAPGDAGAYTLTVHLDSGEFQAGGTAPAPAAPALLAGPLGP